MFSILPITLIILSLVVIIFIIVRKFPQLSLLDVDSIPEVKMEKKKTEIIRKKIAVQSKEAGEKRKILFKPIIQKSKDIQLIFRKYVGQIERVLVKKEKEKRESAELPENRLEKAKQIRVLLQEGNYALEQNDRESAEQKFISAIKLDSKNIEAYQGLGDVYVALVQLDQAEETFKFLLQMDPNNIHALIKLGEIAEQKGKVEESLEYYEQVILQEDSNPSRFVKIAELLKSIGKYDPAFEAISRALELEPQNPKYLDMSVDIGVLCGNKEKAMESYERLRMVNPENQKLMVLKEKIDNPP